METAFKREEPLMRGSLRLSWGAIFGGALLAAGLWILFHVLGLAAGLAAIDPNSPESLRAAGIGKGGWSAVASLLALMAGGILAGRVAGPVGRTSSVLHGAVLWAVTTTAGLALIVAAAGTALQGAERVGGAAVNAAGDLGSLARSQTPMEALDLDAGDMLVPLNRRLREQGKDEVPPEQIRPAVQAAAKTVVQQGRFDRTVFTSALMHDTALSRANAEDLADQIEQSTDRLSERMRQIQTSALQAAESTGKGMWWVVGALLLGLLAAVGGAAVGTWTQERRSVAHVRAPSRSYGISPGLPTHSQYPAPVN